MQPGCIGLLFSLLGRSTVHLPARDRSTNAHSNNNLWEPCSKARSEGREARASARDGRSKRNRDQRLEEDRRGRYNARIRSGEGTWWDGRGGGRSEVLEELSFVEPIMNAAGVGGHGLRWMRLNLGPWRGTQNGFRHFSPDFAARLSAESRLSIFNAIMSRRV